MRVTTWPAWRIRYSSRRNSRGCRSIAGSAALGGAGEKIELEIAHLQPRLHRRRRAAAHQRVDARQQFDEGVGLGEIIVAAGLQALHAVVHFGQARERNSTGVALPCSRISATTLQAVQLGQHAVDDRHVVGPRQRQRQPDFAIGGIVHHMAGLLQPLTR